MNAAQQFILYLFAMRPAIPKDYKAPHAYRGTPQRLRKGRVTKRRLSHI